MSSEKIIRISPEGDLYFLTHGDDDLLELGDAEIVRASHVRFDNDQKKWFVYLRLHSSELELKLRPGHTTRRAALDQEVEVCQNILEKRLEDVEAMFEKGMVEDMVGARTSG